jgi:hypothetical protein
VEPETSAYGTTLPFNTCPLIDRFLGAIAREQTDRFRPDAVVPARAAERLLLLRVLGCPPRLNGAGGLSGGRPRSLIRACGRE